MTMSPRPGQPALTDPLLQLIHRVSGLVNLGQPAKAVADGSGFEYQGVRMALACDPRERDGLAVIHAELGPPPPGRETETYELMLRTNLLLNRGCSPSYGMQIESRCAVLMTPFVILATGPRDLIGHMSRAAAAVQLWKDTDGFSPGAVVDSDGSIGGSRA